MATDSTLGCSIMALFSNFVFRTHKCLLPMGKLTRIFERHLHCPGSLVSLLALITNFPGKVAHQNAFSVKTPNTVQKTPFSHLKNGSSYEFPLNPHFNQNGNFLLKCFDSDFKRRSKDAKHRRNPRKPPKDAHTISQ